MATAGKQIEKYFLTTTSGWFESNGESIEEEKGSHHNISLILDWGDVKKEPKGGSLNIES